MSAAARLPRPIRALAVVHPFPSILNASLVVALVLIAGGPPSMAMTLGLAMLGLQCSIGAFNDLVDEPIDATSRPAKPLPSGYLTSRTALAIAIGAGVLGLGLSASYGSVVLALAVAMHACGLAYDFWLKPTPFASLCYAIAFPLLPVYAWYAAAGTLPPLAQLLLPVAALAGPTLQLANGIVDVEADARAGLTGPVVRLGRRRAYRVLTGLVALIYGLAWTTLLIGSGVPAASLGAAAIATALAGAGLLLSGRDDPALRERGWQAQAIGIVILGAAWVLAAV